VSGASLRAHFRVGSIFEKYGEQFGCPLQKDREQLSTRKSDGKTKIKYSCPAGRQSNHHELAIEARIYLGDRSDLTVQ
jgi:hypothetical protein